MALSEITIDLEEIQALIQADTGLAQLLERLYNAVLEAEMTEHLQAAPAARTASRQGYPNGHRSRQLTNRVGTLELEVPRDRDGPFSSTLFARYQRSEEALVTTLMELVVQAAFPGVIWQRCQAHFRRNVLDKTPPEYRDRMQAVLDTILHAPSPAEARAAFEAADEIQSHAATAYPTLEAGWEAATAVLSLPKKYRLRLRTSHMLERLIEELRRRERVIRIFPNLASCWRLLGALCAEQHETWATNRRYFDMTEYQAWKQKTITTEQQQAAAT